MKLRNHLRAACLLAFSLTSQAQTTNKSTEELADLIVTAGITPIEANQYGGSVTLITAADIEAYQATYLSDVLRQVPGFAINQSGGPGSQTQLRVRGSEANHVLVLLDGVRVNDPTASDEFLINYGLTNNIARIEIIRGPQSAIWGTDAVSAVINIITKNASQNQWGANLELGSFDSKRLGLNAAYGQNNWFLDAGINALDSAGSNISRQGSEADGFENLNTYLKWGMDLNANFDLKLSLNHSDAMNEFDSTDFIVTGLPTDADLWTERTQSTAQFALGFKPIDGRWQSQFQYHWTDTAAENYTFGLGETSATAATTDEVKINTTVSLGKNGKQNLSFAFDHRQVDFTQSGEASNFGDPNQHQSYHVTGLALEYRHQFNENFNANLSARNDDFNRFEDVSNVKLATSYRINDGLRLRGAFGTGSKAPSFIERFGFFPANFIGNPQLKPEESDAFELAVIKTWAQVELELVYFDQNLSNEINGFAYDVDSGLFTANNQTGESQRRGLELNGSNQINSQLGIDFNYTYTDSTEENNLGDEVKEVRRPKNMANLIINYQFADDRARLHTQARYVGDQLDVFFDPNTYESSNPKLDAFTTVDLTFTWQHNDKLQSYVKAMNVFDERYEEVLGYARPGANFSVGIKADF
ncbi:TonB-dependent receptor plug domain-containing protein [Marinicella litoralis]|uniref:Vitamin B12 transporter n=1 Tax=Marinicella litoralis TaxID=644220 RepID=A0A4R6XYF5_9GAMM|nr:TonB-dependent receptor [Marinicella litoralis]TDR23550.1 vitamin B12 transporter [Marinicella litoralis]